MSIRKRISTVRGNAGKPSTKSDRLKRALIGLKQRPAFYAHRLELRRAWKQNVVRFGDARDLMTNTNNIIRRDSTNGLSPKDRRRVRRLLNAWNIRIRSNEEYLQKVVDLLTETRHQISYLNLSADREYRKKLHAILNNQRASLDAYYYPKRNQLKEILDGLESAGKDRA